LTLDPLGGAACADIRWEKHKDRITTNKKNNEKNNETKRHFDT
jgi:hypothetical protein